MPGRRATLRVRASQLSDWRVPVLIGLLALVLWSGIDAITEMFPVKPYEVANDWRVFYAAAQLVQRGGNLYNPIAVHLAQQAVWRFPPSSTPLNYFLDLPVVAWLLTPFTLLGFWASFVVWTSIGVLVAAAWLRAWLRESGWLRCWPWVVAGLALRPVLEGFAGGQFDALMLGGLLGSLLLMRRNRPWLAGLCMVVVLLKPDLLWPLPLLLFAVWTPQPARAWRFAAAAAGVVIGGAAAGFALGPGLADYVTHVFGLAASSFGNVPADMSGIPRLLAPLPGGRPLGDAVSAVGALLVLVLAVACWRNRGLRRLPDRDRAVVVLTGLAVWLACTNYVHSVDDVLLLPLLAVLIGVRGEALDVRWMGAAAVVCLVFMAALDVSWWFVDALLLLVVVLWIWRRRLVSQGAAGSVSLVATVLLQVAEPLSPVMAATIAAAGVLWVVTRMRGAVATPTDAEPLPRFRAAHRRVAAPESKHRPGWAGSGGGVESDHRSASPVRLEA
ncbi:MAG: glycosyltransferase family 87 protein [Candidatus Dormibacteria bacterium]